MQIKTLFLTAGTAAPLNLVGAAVATTFTGLAAVVSQGNGDDVDMVVNLYATFDVADGDDFSHYGGGIPVQPVNISVNNGVFYQHPLGTDTAPDQALIDMSPSLAWDTFVTIGARSFGTKTVREDATQLFGWPGFCESELFVDDGTWFVRLDSPQALPGEADNPPNQVLLGQFSVSAGATSDVVVSGILLVRGVEDGRVIALYIGFDAPFCALTDIDDDGITSTPDLLNLVAQWGPCEAECTADFRGDGMVSTRDLLDLIENWGPCP